eukprot:6182038-Pleurochrysis_carterae.AAC.2
MDGTGTPKSSARRLRGAPSSAVERQRSDSNLREIGASDEASVGENSGERGRDGERQFKEGRSSQKKTREELAVRRAEVEGVGIVRGASRCGDGAGGGAARWKAQRMAQAWQSLRQRLGRMVSDARLRRGGGSPRHEHGCSSFCKAVESVLRQEEELGLKGASVGHQGRTATMDVKDHDLQHDVRGGKAGVKQKCARRARCNGRVGACTNTARREPSRAAEPRCADARCS